MLSNPPQPLCLPAGSSCYRSVSNTSTCTIPCHGLYSGDIFPTLIPSSKLLFQPYLISDVTKEYANTSHTISPTTPGMEMMMEEYIAYKAGTRRDPVAYLNGGKAQIKKNNCESQHPASIGWVALFSVIVRSFVPHRWHLLSSPLYDISEHTNHIFSVRIWSWQHVSVYISSVAELSPVYCCLVYLHFRLGGGEQPACGDNLHQQPDLRPDHEGRQDDLHGQVGSDRGHPWPFHRLLCDQWDWGD